jgi:hypothetical protein
MRRAKTRIKYGIGAPLVSELFWALMDDIGARRIVLVAGKDWWPEVRGLLDLGDLRDGERPVLAAGRSHGRQVVASYHPRGARQQGIRDEQLVEAIAAAFCRRARPGHSANMCRTGNRSTRTR